MPYPELVWTLLVTIGGLLLIENPTRLSPRAKYGIGVIYAGFLVQVYWNILHKAPTSQFVWDTNSQWQVGFVTAMVILSVVLIKRRERVSEEKT